MMYWSPKSFSFFRFDMDCFTLEVETINDREQKEFYLEHAVEAGDEEKLQDGDSIIVQEVDVTKISENMSADDVLVKMMKITVHAHEKKEDCKKE